MPPYLTQPSVPLHYGPTSPPQSRFQQAYDFLHTSYPDYASIIAKLIAPLQAQNKAKLAALGAQTDEEKALANKNAQIQQQMAEAAHRRAKQELFGSLTGRGLINSGEKNYQVGYLDKTFEQTSALSANQLLAYLMSLENQYKNAAMDAAAAEQQALIDAQNYAATNYSPNIHYNPWAPQPATLNPGLHY